MPLQFLLLPMETQHQNWSCMVNNYKHKWLKFVDITYPTTVISWSLRSTNSCRDPKGVIPFKIKSCESFCLALFKKCLIIGKLINFLVSKEKRFGLMKPNSKQLVHVYLLWVVCLYFDWRAVVFRLDIPVKWTISQDSLHFSVSSQEAFMSFLTVSRQGVLLNRQIFKRHKNFLKKNNLEKLISLQWHCQDCS